MRISPSLIFLLFFIFLLKSNAGKALDLSDQAEISILTCSPGNEIYSVYGHSAIRIKDTCNNYDVVYNYGIFDFNTPNFLYRFASGQTDYLLGVYSFEDFYYEYLEEKRSIFEQVLNLSQIEKQKIFNFLDWNAKPENREYRYNFFYDNCATRVRDVIKKNIDGLLIFPYKSENPKTFRELIKEFHGKLFLPAFGIDLVVCAPSDKFATPSDEMFLPDYLMAHFSNSVIEKGNRTIPLVKDFKIIYEAPTQEYSESGFLSPVFIFLLLALLVIFISFRQFRKNNIRNGLDYFIYGINGFMGVVILWFVLFSEHPAMHPNFNLMWALPINLIFAIIWAVEKWRPFTKYYHVFISCWLLIFVFSATLLPQKFHIGIYLFILIVLSRSVMHSIIIFSEKRSSI